VGDTDGELEFSVTSSAILENVKERRFFFLVVVGCKVKRISKNE
jgi:hypothetical protein